MSIASARHRKSPYPLISFEAALDYLHTNIEVLATETRIVGELDFKSCDIKANALSSGRQQLT